MKKSFTLFLMIFLFVLKASPQGRIVLLEEFTNDRCGPCKEFSPVLDGVIEKRIGNVIGIKYHGFYPDREDPIYLAQKKEIDKRLQFYDNYTSSSYPTLIINGHKANNARTAELIESGIDYYLAKPEKYQLKGNYELRGAHVKVSTSLTPSEDVKNDNLRLFVAILEEHIRYDKPLPNGETELNYTCRQLLPNGDGAKVGPELEAGRNYEQTFEWDIENFEDISELGVVVFLQDMDTKDILSTTYVPKKAAGDNVVMLMYVDNVPENICEAVYQGDVIFRNMGANPINGGTLNVRINETTKSYPWTGNVGYLETDTIEFRDFNDFILNRTKRNSVSIWMSKVNGQDVESNSIKYFFDSSIQIVNGLELKIYTDNAPEETTWRIYDSAGDVVGEGGPYKEQRHFYVEEPALEKEDCYTLEFLDSGGNGIADENGRGGYYVLSQINSDGTKGRVQTGSYTGGVFDIPFHFVKEKSDGIDDVDSYRDMGAEVKIYDVSGKLVRTTTVGELDLKEASGLAKGIYILKTEKSTGVVTKKILKD